MEMVSRSNMFTTAVSTQKWRRMCFKIKSNFYRSPVIRPRHAIRKFAKYLPVLANPLGQVSITLNNRLFVKTLLVLQEKIRLRKRKDKI